MAALTRLNVASDVNCVSCEILSIYRMMYTQFVAVEPDAYKCDTGPYKNVFVIRSTEALNRITSPPPYQDLTNTTCRVRRECWPGT